MQGQKVLFVGGQGPVSAPAARLLAADNQVFAMARFSDPKARQKLEASGITCLVHDLLDPFDDLPTDFDYVYHTAMPMSSVFEPLGRWPDSFDTYADATGRLMAHLPGLKGFLLASTASVYDPPGGATAVPETHSFGIHTSAAYAFTKVANEQIVSYLSRSLATPATIIRVHNASGVDGGPMRDRLDLIVQGKPILLHPDKPNYARPIFEPDSGAPRGGRARGGSYPAAGGQLVRRRSHHDRGVLHVHGSTHRAGAGLRVHIRRVATSGARHHLPQRGARPLRDQLARRMPDARRAVLPGSLDVGGRTCGWQRPEDSAPRHPTLVPHCWMQRKG